MSDSTHGYPRERAAFYHHRTVAAERQDVDYYRELATVSAGPVLEMACGTGRVSLPLLEAGVDLDGFDRSAGALGVLRETAAEMGLSPTVWQADMTQFAVDRDYDLVICPFNALQHMLTVDDQLAALDHAYAALAPGGRFCFDVFVPGFEFICDTYGEWQTESIEYRGGTHEYRTRAAVDDEIAQSFTVENELVDPSGATVFTADHRMSMLPRQHVELLARHSPFADWSVTGDFGGSALADGDTVQCWTLVRAA